MHAQVPGSLPVRRYGIDPVLTPQLFRYFFMERTNALEAMSPQQRRHVTALYGLEGPGDPDSPTGVAAQRFSLRCPAYFRLRGSAEQATVVSVDGGELTVVFDHACVDMFGFDGPVQVCLSAHTKADIEVRYVGLLGDDPLRYRFAVTQADAAWQDLQRRLWACYTPTELECWRELHRV